MISVAAVVRELEAQRVNVLEAGVRHATREIRGGGVDRTGEDAPDEWRSWLDALFPGRRVYAAHHVELWEHIWAVELASSPDPYVAIWARGGGKSSSAEWAAAALGLRGRRRYLWYVRETQARADDSLKNIQALLERSTVERYYPAHAERRLTKYGHSRDWNSTRLTTAGGLTIEAIGLDTAVRGLKVEDERPDAIILDDLDGKHDSAKETKKKAETLTSSVLGAGTARTAVLAIQNLITPNGIFSQLADGRADYLVTRRMSGPVPAIHGLKTEVRHDQELGRARAFITAGTPAWEGQGLEDCQRLMDRIGLRAFLKECQHEVKKREGALWTPDLISSREEAPPLERVVVAVDPSGGTAEIGIVGVGRGYDGRAYVLADRTQLGAAGPLNWGRAAVECYDEFKADRILGERNFGGDMVESTIQVGAASLNGSDRRVPVRLVTASRGKAIRAEPVVALYEDGLVDHIGTLVELEDEMTGWVPGDPNSPNRLDALVIALTELMIEAPGPRRGVYFPGMTDDASATQEDEEAVA